MELNKVVDAMEEDSAAAAPADQSRAQSAESTDTDEEVKAQALGATNDAAVKGREDMDGVVEEPKEAEKTQEQVGDEAAGGEGTVAIAMSNGEGVSAAKEKEEDEGGGVTDADVYTRDMALLRSANGLVAEVGIVMMSQIWAYLMLHISLDGYGWFFHLSNYDALPLANDTHRCVHRSGRFPQTVALSSCKRATPVSVQRPIGRHGFLAKRPVASVPIEAPRPI